MNHQTRLRRALGLLILASAARATDAQGSEVALAPATATFAHEFTRVASLRELSDGRVLAVDDGTLIVLDPRTADTRPIGARGAGPNEYRDAMQLVALAGDTTLMADASNRRLMLLHRDRIVSVTPVNDPVFALLGWDLRGADAHGRVLARRQMAPDGFMVPRQRNRAAFVRVDRRNVAVDTVAIGKGMEMEVTPMGSPERRSFRTMTVVLAVEEPAVLFADGWVAIARQEPYRIDWHPPSGALRPGKPIEPVAPRVNDAEKADWKRRTEEFTGKPFTMSLNDLSWAEFVPPFVDDLVALPDGRLLVPRHPWSGSRGTEFDIVDRDGVRVARMRLGANERVVGSGRDVLYVAVRDEDGLERLRRHPWQ